MVSAALRIRRLMLILGDPSRWSIARALEDGGRCVTDLARTVGLSQSCTTRHLQALERERIVHSSRDGRRVIYALRVEDAQVAGVLSMVLRAAPAATIPGRQSPAGAPRPASPGRPARRPRPPAPRPERAPALPPVTEAPEPEAPGPSAFRIRSEIEDYLL
jgi:DNA-binding transcriptional ArsR family regulator